MKYLNIKLYLLGLFVSILGIIAFIIIQGQNNFGIVILGIVISIILINISSILFYNSLENKKEIFKYIFSIIHIVPIIFMTLFL